MYKVILTDGVARKCAAQAIRAARATSKGADEVFGNAIVIASNLIQMDREGGNFARANAYKRAARALDSAAPLALS